MRLSRQSDRPSVGACPGRKPRALLDRYKGSNMRPGARRVRGFTLIELMTTILVIVVLLILATPSFISFRQRSALRGAGEQVFSLWNQARLEAAKRNQLVKFVVKSSGTDF